MNISAIIMASGFSERLGSNKLFLPYKGHTLLQRTLDMVLQAGFHQVLAVLSPQNAVLAKLPPGVLPIINLDYVQGQSASVRHGVQNATGDAYMFFPADQPYLDVDSILKIAQACTTDTIAVPIVQGRQGSPVCFGRRFREELLHTEGDKGGRPVKRRHPEACVMVEMENQKLFYDIDTEEDYAQLLRSDDQN